MLVGDPRDVTVVEADQTTEVDQVVVWRRKRNVPSGTAAIEPPFDPIANELEQVAGLAADLVEHLSAQRMKLFDHVELKADGSWRPRPTQTLPWMWWLQDGALEDDDRELLETRFQIIFEPAK